jgi:hypothetical protein
MVNYAVKNPLLPKSVVVCPVREQVAPQALPAIHPLLPKSVVVYPVREQVAPQTLPAIHPLLPKSVVVYPLPVTQHSLIPISPPLITNGLFA